MHLQILEFVMAWLSKFVIHLSWEDDAGCLLNRTRVGSLSHFAIIFVEIRILNIVKDLTYKTSMKFSEEMFGMATIILMLLTVG